MATRQRNRTLEQCEATTFHFSYQILLYTGSGVTDYCALTLLGPGADLRKFGAFAVYFLYQSFAEIAVLQWLDIAGVAFETPKE